MIKRVRLTKMHPTRFSFNIYYLKKYDKQKELKLPLLR